MKLFVILLIYWCVFTTTAELTNKITNLQYTIILKKSIDSSRNSTNLHAFLKVSWVWIENDITVWPNNKPTNIVELAIFQSSTLKNWSFRGISRFKYLYTVRPGRIQIEEIDLTPQGWELKVEGQKFYKAEIKQN